MRPVVLASLFAVAACSRMRCHSKDNVEKLPEEHHQTARAFTTLAEGCDETARLSCAGFGDCFPVLLVSVFGDDSTCRSRLAAQCKATSSSESGATVDSYRACAQHLARTSCEGWKRYFQGED